MLAASRQNKKHVVIHEQSSVKSRLGNRSPTAANCLKKIYFSGGAAVTPSTWSGDDGRGAGSRNMRQITEAEEPTWQDWWHRWGCIYNWSAVTLVRRQEPFVCTSSWWWVFTYQPSLFASRPWPDPSKPSNTAGDRSVFIFKNVLIANFMVCCACSQVGKKWANKSPRGPKRTQSKLILLDGCVLLHITFRWWVHRNQ